MDPTGTLPARQRLDEKRRLHCEVAMPSVTEEGRAWDSTSHLGEAMHARCRYGRGATIKGRGVVSIGAATTVELSAQTAIQTVFAR